jgi:hypothetical protein
MNLRTHLAQRSNGLPGFLDRHSSVGVTMENPDRKIPPLSRQLEKRLRRVRR